MIAYHEFRLLLSLSTSLSPASTSLVDKAGLDDSSLGNIGSPSRRIKLTKRRAVLAERIGHEMSCRFGKYPDDERIWALLASERRSGEPQAC